MSEPEAQKELTPSLIQKTLDWAYDKAVNGIPGLGTAQDLADFFMRGDWPLERKVWALIHWQNTKAVTAGFITGLGGVFALPVSIPADLASSLFIHVRMIAAIAIMEGYDVSDERVKALVYTCLAANSIKEAIEPFGLDIERQVAKNVIVRMSGKTLREVNRKVGVKIMSRFGRRGAISFVKGVPLLGGFMNAAVNLVTTYSIARISTKTLKSVQLVEL